MSTPLDLDKLSEVADAAQSLLDSMSHVKVELYDADGKRLRFSQTMSAHLLQSKLDALHATPGEGT
jgi:hypothetical protein